MSTYGYDGLAPLIESSFADVVEATAIAKAGPGGEVYAALLDAHIALQKARNAYLDEIRAWLESERRNDVPDWAKASA